MTVLDPGEQLPPAIPVSEPVPVNVKLLATQPPTAPAPTVAIPNPALPATTTHQEDLTTSGQRRINLVWEFTQAAIAIVFVLANAIVGVAQGLGLVAIQTVPPLLSNALFLIVGFYFSRTNHEKTGGVGPKPNDQYQGR